MSEGGAMQTTATATATEQPLIKLARFSGLLIIRLLGVPIDTSYNYAKNYPQINQAYPETADGLGIQMTDVTLVSPGSSWKIEDAIGLAAKLGHPIAGYQQVLALGEIFPTLDVDLGVKPLVAVCLKACEYKGLPYSLSLWWSAGGRLPGMIPVADAHRADDYFAVLGDIAA